MFWFLQVMQKHMLSEVKSWIIIWWSVLSGIVVPKIIKIRWSSFKLWSINFGVFFMRHSVVVVVLVVAAAVVVLAVVVFVLVLWCMCVLRDYVGITCHVKLLWRCVSDVWWREVTSDSACSISWSVEDQIPYAAFYWSHLQSDLWPSCSFSRKFGPLARA